MAGPGQPPDHHLVLAALQLARQPHVGALLHHVLRHAEHAASPGQEGNWNIGEIEELSLLVVPSR